MQKLQVIGLVAAVAVGTVLTGVDDAAETHGIPVDANQQISAVQLTLSLDRLTGVPAAVAQAPGFRVGDLVRICFSASADGYETIWSYNADCKIDRIYQTRVDANARYCIGGAESNFRIVVEPPLGRSWVLAHWTSRQEAQSADAHPDVGGGRRALLQECRRDGERRIRHPGRPTGPIPRARHISGPVALRKRKRRTK
jgi:hypothetical protein